MKKIFGILLLSGAVTLVSCDDDLLNSFTPGATTEEVAFQTSGDIQKMMNSAYALLTPLSDLEFNSVFTDEAGIGYANGGQGLNDNYAFLLNSGSGSPDGIWSTYYLVMSRANRVIAFADRVVPVDAVDADLIKRMKAEALVLRAYSHIQLVSYFSTNPKDRNALGVMMADGVYSVGTQLPRVTNGAIYDLVDADLNAALAIFNAPSVAPAYATPSLYANKYFAVAMQARVNALRGDYANALTYANDVINNSGISLASFSNYTSVFLTDANANNSEVLFKVKKLNGQTRTGAVWASVNASVGGSPFFEIGRSLFNLINTTEVATASNNTVVSIAGTSLTLANATNVSVNDEFVFTTSFPTTAAMNGGGTATIPANAIVAGKVYFVKTKVGNVITLTTAPNGTTTANFTAANTATNLAVKHNNGDIRYGAIVHPTSIINYDYRTVADFRNTDKLAMGKYPGTAANGNLVNDIKISRISEMYLIKAEALTNAGDLAGAAAVVKELRDARFNVAQPLPVYAAAVDAWKDILKERRIEFAFEGYRYIDLKRLGTLANETIVRDARDCEINGQCTLPITDHRFTLPIPASELGVNQSIRGQQNPGY
ncbi:RagB/SusD family nutrient uptake outer membrane protein [Flavobacterium sp. SM15]|uniref:RagB/SusD family nutrient uptake outer membrane protein n=1 Tax=Flavobacterium sp. SM15 TaxID=2908005 RepID=UPI001EDBBB69|nr:RagB/SusD family nutrient uptake outer membrane protein [Flavobacterium sp. SM15]MCG2610606.1 RagB/SusD family nutrient uptake outer membrane protein [Flavobacterium sp. SM15]